MMYNIVFHLQTRNLCLNPDRKATLLLNRTHRIDSAAAPCTKGTPSIAATVVPVEVVPSVADVVSHTQPSSDATPTKVESNCRVSIFNMWSPLVYVRSLRKALIFEHLTSIDTHRHSRSSQFK